MQSPSVGQAPQVAVALLSEVVLHHLGSLINIMKLRGAGFSPSGIRGVLLSLRGQACSTAATWVKISAH